MTHTRCPPTRNQQPGWALALALVWRPMARTPRPCGLRLCRESPEVYGGPDQAATPAHTGTAGGSPPLPSKWYCPAHLTALHAELSVLQGHQPRTGRGVLCTHERAQVKGEERVVVAKAEVIVVVRCCATALQEMVRNLHKIIRTLCI